MVVGPRFVIPRRCEFALSASIQTFLPMLFSWLSLSSGNAWSFELLSPCRSQAVQVHAPVFDSGDIRGLGDGPMFNKKTIHCSPIGEV